MWHWHCCSWLPPVARHSLQNTLPAEWIQYPPRLSLGSGGVGVALGGGMEVGVRVGVGGSVAGRCRGWSCSGRGMTRSGDRRRKGGRMAVGVRVGVGAVRRSPDFNERTVDHAPLTCHWRFARARATRMFVHW